MERGLVAVGLCLLAACQRAESPEQMGSSVAAEADSARGDITDAVRNYDRWLSAGDVDSLATIVADDYQAMAPNQPTVAGKAQWVTWTRQLVAQGSWESHVTVESLEVHGPLAVLRGRYTLSMVPSAPGPRGVAAVSDTGKLLWQWRRVEGGWRIAAAAWSSDLPAKP